MMTVAPINTSRGFRELEEQRNSNMSTALNAADEWLRGRNLIPMAS
jgi:hypothetical protein